MVQDLNFNSCPTVQSWTESLKDSGEENTIDVGSVGQSADQDIVNDQDLRVWVGLQLFCEQSIIINWRHGLK